MFNFFVVSFLLGQKLALENLEKKNQRISYTMKKRNGRDPIRLLEREARVGTIRKTTNGHHQLALALTHHGVRKEKKNFKKEKISEKRILLVV